MEIRPVRPADLDVLYDIDGTVESSQYLHLEKSGEGLSVGWRVEPRPLRERRTDPNRLDDDRKFIARQIATGADEGLALMAEHDGAVVALLLAQPEPGRGVLRVHDLRVDFDQRRQGLGSALMYQAITDARTRELRAVAAESRTDNHPAANFLSKLGFDLAGVDLQRFSNHDLVKEAAALFWYVALG